MAGGERQQRLLPRVPGAMGEGGPGRNHAVSLGPKGRQARDELARDALDTTGPGPDGGPRVDRDLGANGGIAVGAPNRPLRDPAGTSHGGSATGGWARRRTETPAPSEQRAEQRAERGGEACAGQRAPAARIGRPQR